MSTRPLLPSLFRRIQPLPPSQCLLVRLASARPAINGSPRRPYFAGKERQDFGRREEDSAYRGGRAFPPPQGRDFRPSNDRPNGRFNGRPNDRPDDRPDDRPNSRFNGRPDDRPSGRFNDRPNDRPGDRLGGRPDGRPDGRPYSRPDDRPYNRPDDRPGDRPGDIPFGRPPPKQAYWDPTEPRTPRTNSPFNRASGNQRGLGEPHTPSNSTYSPPTDFPSDRSPYNQTQRDRDPKESRTPFNSSYSPPTNSSFDRTPRSQTQGDRDPKDSRTPFNSSPTDSSFGRTSGNQTERSPKEPRTPSNSSLSSPTDSSFDHNPRNQTQSDRDSKESRTSSYSPPTDSIDRTPRSQTQQDTSSRESRTPLNIPYPLHTGSYPSRLKSIESPYVESRPSRPKPIESPYVESRPSLRLDRPSPPSLRLDRPSPSPDTTTSSGIWNPPGSTRPTYPVRSSYNTSRTWSPSPESYTDAFSGTRSWQPGRPCPRLDHAPQDAEWTPKPRRHIPKLDPDAEWIYGTNVVEAALMAKRRKMLRLYIYDGIQRTPDARERDKAMEKLAKAVGIKVIREQDLGMLDSMTDSRVHNGYVLECLPLPKTPILSLGAVTPTKSSFSVNLAKHTPTNEEIPADKYPTTIYNRDPKRYPFVLMLDEILDPGNLGAILRSAYFLGVTAVTLSSRNCAPLSPVCQKAAVGATEFIPILEQARSDKLITSSIENGWTFYAAVPPATKNQKRRDRYVLTSDVGTKLDEGPVCLVLGNEGDGLRSTLKYCVQYCVSFEKAPGTDRLVDSLNVSVAAALLSNSFLNAS